MEDRKTRGQSGGYRTVVVGDDPLFRDWLRLLLENSSDFEVMGEACTGAECLGLLNPLTPDVLLLDVDMPDRDGLELAGHISADLPGLRTIAVRSHGDRAYSRLAELEGAIAFMPKSDLCASALLQSLRVAPGP